MLGTTLNPNAYLQRLQQETKKIDRRALERWFGLIYEAWQQQRFVLLIGNGG